MRVGINARLLHDPSIRGWNRYTINLSVELADLGVDLFLLSDKPLHETHLRRLAHNNIRTCISTSMKYLRWEQVWLRARMQKVEARRPALSTELWPAVCQFLSSRLDAARRNRLRVPRQEAVARQRIVLYLDDFSVSSLCRKDESPQGDNRQRTRSRRFSEPPENTRGKDCGHSQRRGPRLSRPSR